jgi:membrane protease YdiL (CAAX protease family)
MPVHLTAAAGAPFAPELAAWDPERFWLAGLVYTLLCLAGLAVDLLLLILLLCRPPRFERRIARLLCRPVAPRDGAQLVAVLAVLFLFAAALAGAVPLRPGIVLALQSLLFHWLLLALFAWALRKRRLSAARAFGLRRGRTARDAAVGVIGYLAMLPGFVLCAFLYRLALEAVGYEPRLQPVAEAITGEPLLGLRAYLLFMGIVAAPVTEELVFRGTAYPILARRLGPAAAAVLLSLVFAAIHFHPEAALPLFLVSICLCAAYAVTGSLLVPMVMHGLFNGVNLAVLLLVAP